MRVNTNQYFKEIIPNEGYVLTDWDANDIKDFTFYEIMAVPFSFNEAALREITIEEKEYILKLQEEDLNNDSL